MRFALGQLPRKASFSVVFPIQLLLNAVQCFSLRLHPGLGQTHAHVFVHLFGAVVPLGLPGLLLERLQVLVDLKEQVAYAVEVGVGALELAQRLFFAHPELADTRRLLKQVAARVVLVVEQVVDHLELDDGVAVRGNAGVHEQVGDVFEPTGDAVELVLAVARAVVAAGNGYLRVFGGQQVAGVVEGERDLGQLGGLALLGAVEDDILHFVGAQGAGLLLAQHPADGINDVGLATTIGPDNAGDAAVEVDGNFIAKTLESF